jgi:hypothetical protein
MERTMIDMSTWEDVEADVMDDLHLDPRNVRLQMPPYEVPEADIIHDLFANERAFGLVEAIAQVGYLTHELPIVVIRGGKMVVAEGNRRVAALKAIQNPYLAPEYRARIVKMAARIPDRDSLKIVRVKIAPSQDEADQLIAAIHTGKQRVPWSPTRQAAFFQAQIDSGKSLKQLLDQYPTIDVRDFVVRSEVMDLFRSVRYSDPSLKDFVMARRFPYSTLARLYTYDKFQELARIQVDRDHASVVLRGSKKQFAKLAEKIISDMKAKRIDTRILNSTQSYDYKSYMDELRNLVNEFDESEDGPSKSLTADVGQSTKVRSGGNDSLAHEKKKGTRAASDGAVSGEHGTAVGAERSKSGPSNYLDTDGLDATGFPPAIGFILNELSLINVNRFPNATFDLLRTFLEKTIKAYAAKLNQDIKKSSNQVGYVYLSNALIWLEEHVKTTGLTALIQVIQKIRGGKIEGFIASKTHLDAINHNQEIFATPSDVRECWNTMRVLLALMLKP